MTEKSGHPIIVQVKTSVIYRQLLDLCVAKVWRSAELSLINQNERSGPRFFSPRHHVTLKIAAVALLLDRFSVDRQHQLFLLHHSQNDAEKFKMSKHIQQHTFCMQIAFSSKPIFKIECKHFWKYGDTLIITWWMRQQSAPTTVASTEINEGKKLSLYISSAAELISDYTILRPHIIHLD